MYQLPLSNIFSLSLTGGRNLLRVLTHVLNVPRGSSPWRTHAAAPSCHTACPRPPRSCSGCPHCPWLVCHGWDLDAATLRIQHGTSGRRASRHMQQAARRCVRSIQATTCPVQCGAVPSRSVQFSSALLCSAPLRPARSSDWLRLRTTRRMKRRRARTHDTTLDARSRRRFDSWPRPPCIGPHRRSTDSHRHLLSGEIIGRGR